jgi:excisionase family DNA binding protein
VSRDELNSALAQARQLPLEELPRLLGDLEEVRATALARLTSPAPQQQPDELLDVREASRRLGVSTDYLYRHHRSFPFIRRVGRSLRFSAAGLEDYIRQRNGLTARRQSAILPVWRKS